MAIQVTDRIPNVRLFTMSANGPTAVETADFFARRKAVLFSVPGAFTPTCSAKHFPGFVQNADKFFSMGVQVIACTAVNDAYVMDAWRKEQGGQEKIEILADGNGDLVRALGLSVDLSPYGMGVRGRRFSMILDDGVVKTLNVEEPGSFKISSAEHTLSGL